jgi:uncharacterized protein (DUF2235 family)
MKRIITCSDGTWNRPNIREGGKPIKTNVQKIFDFIEKRDEKDTIQIKYYDEGIGAQGSIFTRMLNGATGKGIDDNIRDIYKFICWNYEPGDDIYLFGFSRGAYTARSLAGLIRKCGIIKTNNLDLIGEAYKLYRNTQFGPTSETATQFRKTHSHDVASIKFIGVWDTVGSLGLPLNITQWYNKKHYAFYDTKLSSIVEYAYHAIAVDERRKTFSPCLWQKSDNIATGVKQVLEQRWFAGVHSNVGGGYPDAGLSDIALKWLFSKAEDIGLRMDQQFKETPDNYKGELYNSRSGFYKLLPGKIREIVVDNKESFIDESVYRRMELLGEAYRPPNVAKRERPEGIAVTVPVPDEMLKEKQQ